MKTSSAKAKGRKLQVYIVNKILEYFPFLSPLDVVSVPGSVSGDDIRLSGEAVKTVPFSIEAKNTERLNIWAALKQSENENRTLTPLLVFKRNRSEVYCALKFETFMYMLQRYNAYLPEEHK